VSSFEISDQPAALNQALFQVTHGLYVLTAARGGEADSKRLNGQCLDAAMQVTSTPPRVAIGVGKKSLTHQLISQTGKFVLNVLDRKDPKCPDIIRRFGFQSGRDVNKFEDFSFELSSGGLPVLPDAKAFYECTVIQELTLDLDTHSLFVASVNRAGVKERGEPLTYNEYRKTIRKRR
jgi:flavin reductase (DIM6/NTAB) family NADH-FMN oxidoreductase RutF